MAVNWPDNPTDGQEHVEAGQTWVYRSPPNVWAIKTEALATLPSGGVANDALMKASADDYDADWRPVATSDIAGLADEYVAKDGDVMTGDLEVPSLTATGPVNEGTDLITAGGAETITAANGTRLVVLPINNVTFTNGLLEGESVTVYINNPSGFTIDWGTTVDVWLTADGLPPAPSTNIYTAYVLDKFNGGGTFGIVTYGYAAVGNDVATMQLPTNPDATDPPPPVVDNSPPTGEGETP